MSYPKCFCSVLWAIGLSFALCGLSWAAEDGVGIIKAPEGAIVPDVAVDGKGILHMVYGKDFNAYYMRSADNGKTFTAPLKVNSEGTVCNKMGERGPKLAIGGDGAIHVIWPDQWVPGLKVFVRYSRSTDGGKSFEPLKTLSSMPGVDGVTMTADGAGNITAFWHVMDPPQKEIPQATWLYMAYSADKGATFAANQKLNIDGVGGLACSMCMMRARSGDGATFLCYRSADANIRDFHVLKAKVGENRFVAVPVNQDRWELPTCPMCGPEFTAADSGGWVCAFMSRNKVYWAMADKAADRFTLHVPTPASEKDEIYPTAVANKKGQVLMVWQVGPMSLSGTATVKWALYTIDGKFTGRQGTVGKTFSGTKATAFVGMDDRFYVVTTAR